MPILSFSNRNISADKKGIVLFDIDGTLVSGPTDGQSAGLVAMKRSFAKITGLGILADNLDFSGQTDGNIAKSFLERSGIKACPKNIALFLKYYLQYLSQEIVSRPYHSLGNCKGAIHSLSSSGYICGIGTGNLKRGAFLKLKSARIFRYFDLELGGYADDAFDRSEILRKGAHRCDPTGSLPVIIIGDTPLDVLAAQSIEARCIGIPFQKHSEIDLKTAGAVSVTNFVGPHLVTLCDNIVDSCI